MDTPEIDWSKVNKLVQEVNKPEDKRPGPEWFTVKEYAANVRDDGRPIPRPTAQHQIERLLEKGLIERHKSWPSNFYRLAG